MATKMVIVKSRGYVDTSRGRHIFTPIRRPWRESVDMILSMIVNDKADVWEVLPDKTEVKLTTTNYDKDNRPKPAPVSVEEPPKEEPVFTPPVAPATPEPATFEEEPSDSIPKRDEQGHIIFPDDNIEEEVTPIQEEDTTLEYAPQHDGSTLQWVDSEAVRLIEDDTVEVEDVPEPVEEDVNGNEGDDQEPTGKKSKKRNRHRG